MFLSRVSRLIIQPLKKFVVKAVSQGKRVPRPKSKFYASLSISGRQKRLERKGGRERDGGRERE